MAENTILLLTDSHINFVADQVEKLIESENVIIEALDRPAAKLTTKYLNKLVSPYIPDVLKDDIQAALDAVIAGDHDDAVDEAFDAIGELLDTIEIKDGVREILKALLSLLEAALISLVSK